MLFSALGTAQSVATTAGLVAYLPFDETSGSVVHDGSGNGNDGTLTCNGCTPLPAWTTGTRKGSLNFSVPGDFVSVIDSPTLRLTNHFTFTFWAKIPSGVTNIVYLEKLAGVAIGQGSAGSNGYVIGTGNPGNSLYLHLYNNSVETVRCSTAAGAVQAQAWRHYAITYNGSSTVIYVNGIQSVQCNTTGIAGTDSTPLSIGGVNSLNPTGTLDEVRIYNRALSAGEIANVYNDPGVPDVSLAVSPGTQVNLTSSQTQQFTASVLGTANTAVTWSINPQLGSISNSGLYAAPASFATPQSVTVTAISVADSTKSASAQLMLALPPTLATFSLSEFFGATWRDQPIEFRYDGDRPPAATTRMVGPAGVEVPYQWVSSCSDASAVKGCIAVRSSLPARVNYSWKLQSGVTPGVTAVNPAQLNQVGNNIEITNGLTGVRIVTAAANTSPFSLAPIQGIQLADGSWTGAGASPNRLYSQSAGYKGNAGEPLNTPISSAKSYTVNIVDQGPLKTVVTVNYTFDRPQYAIPGVVVINNAGQGHYTLTATLYANSKSVLFDEDTDMELSYYLPVYAQLQPDTARWRGRDSLNGAGIADPACGYESPLTITGATAATPIVITTSASGSLTNGQRVLIAGVGGNAAANGTYYAKTSGYSSTQFALYSDAALTKPVSGSAAGTGGTAKPAYRGGALTPVGDAFQDLTYNLDRSAGYSCTATTYRKMLAAYPPAAHGAGWYVEMYKSSAPATAPVVGFYVGRASKQVYSATGPSLPGLYSSNNHFISRTQDAGIQVDTLLRSADGSIACAGPTPCAAAVHRNWGIFVSTKADLLTPANAHQPIADEQNMLTAINLSHLYSYRLEYPDPPGGWQWLYLPASTANQIQSWVENGTSVCGTPTCYATLLKGSEGSVAGNALVGLWQGNSAAAVQTALNTANSLASWLMGGLTAGDNKFDQSLGYYGLGLQTSPETVVLNAILMNANATAAQKTLAKAELALFGSIFWDDDWFPIDNPSGESLGLANQVQQYLEYRAQSAFADPAQPFLSQQLGAAATYSVNDFQAYFSPTGAAAGSTHYQSAFFEPLILNYMNPATQGLLSMSDPQWAAYANWELSIQTPPEPRFGNVRKGYSNGDGNTEGDVRTGLLATALNPVNPALASNLMWAWQQSNDYQLTEDSQFVTTLAVIDQSIPPVAPQLASTNIPGYHSVERFNFGTPNETALWFINGGFYQVGGHRHYDDGQVSIYADSAPLAIDFNANLYSPETAGRFMHNSIVYDGELGHLWSADKAGLSDVTRLLQNPTNTEFASFGASTHAAATFTSGDGTVWTRTVRTMNFDPVYPVIYVTDRFAGPSAGTGKTLTWNMMAAGAVATPAGQVTPVTRFSTGCQSTAGALPSNGNVYGLTGGLQRFTFTGVAWPKHPAGGINWDLYTLQNDVTGQFFIGNWGHGCHPQRESSEFQKANGVSFSETQHILRVHDNGPLTTILMPWPKTAQPQRTVTQQACGTQIVQTTAAGTATTCFNESAAQFTNGTTSSILSVYDASTQSAFGVTATGGPQEIAIGAGQIVWTTSGVASGVRTVTLPAGWSTTNPQVTQNGNTFTIQYQGGQQTAPVEVVFKSPGK